MAGASAARRRRFARPFATRVAKTLVLAIRNAESDRILRMAAALAFYTALALAPLLVVLLWLLSLLGTLSEIHLVHEVTDLIGDEGGRFVESVIENSKKPQARGWTSVISITALVFSATGVFSELQDSLNRVWRAPVKPSNGVFTWIRRRMLSFAMVGALAFLMLVSLVASTAVSLFEKWFGEATAWRFVSEGLSFGVFVALFAAMFRLLPDIRIAWKDVFGGALVTAAMFVLGKLLIGLYLARGSFGSAYGAAGSMLIILAWVYYSSIIVFFGAELSQAWASLRPQHASRVPRPIDEPKPPDAHHATAQS